MRMNPGPSSARLRSKCTQSTMSGAPSLKLPASPKSKPPPIAAGACRPCPKQRNYPQRVKTCLAEGSAALEFPWGRILPGRVERVARAAKGQPQRHRAELEVAAQGIDQIAAIAFGQLVGAVAEHDEARRPRLDLGDVAQLDPFALRRRRRIGLDCALEPAVELA